VLAQAVSEAALEVDEEALPFVALGEAHEAGSVIGEAEGGGEGSVVIIVVEASRVVAEADLGASVEVVPGVAVVGIVDVEHKY
jgi:hypothetical protein